MENLENLTLLYVEDEINTLLMYEKYFNTKFKTVLKARDGLKAYELYCSNRPDVLILDINIPFLNGLELAKKIRDENKDTKIVILSARDDKETLIQAVELGLLAYVEKPLTRMVVKNLLSKISDSFITKENQEIVIYKDKRNEYMWNQTKKSLYKNGELVKLTKKENSLLNLLIEKSNEIVSFETIYDFVWFEDDYKDFSIPSIKTLIKNLREKLPSSLIESSYGNGFILKL